jgi:hypothetical protein
MSKVILAFRLAFLPIYGVHFIVALKQFWSGITHYGCVTCKYETKCHWFIHGYCHKAASLTACNLHDAPNAHAGVRNRGV